MSWSPQQEAAIKAVADWLANGTQQVFSLFGYAGTGKTTLAKEIAANAGGQVIYAAFTGKASLVLRKKGCENACTIHSLIYKVLEDDQTGKPQFVRNPESAASYAKLIIIDEVSMVNEELGRDLLSFGTKILVLGDPAQLPPVKGEGFFMTPTPDVMLTEVHRQAQDNPIIRLSMLVREGLRLPEGDQGAARVVRRSDLSKDEVRELAMAADQILCGKNATRQTLNTRVREIKGYAGTPAHIPVAGERLVCLKNDRDKRLFNGGMWQVDSASYMHWSARMRITSLDEEAAPKVDVLVPEQYFQGREQELDWRVARNADQFTFGYALTVHKSQGSQWDNVLLFDESGIFRETARHHLYTGLTRAAERITIII